MEIRLDAPTAARAEHLPEVAALLGAVFQKEREWAKELPWQYLENPSGPAWYVNARDEEGELVGHYALIPTPPLDAPHLGHLRVFLSLNTAVHPKAQGKGIFKSTAKALYEHLESLHPTVVLGVANANSVNGFLRSLGFTSLGQLGLNFYGPWHPPAPVGERMLQTSSDYLRWRARRPGAQVWKDARAGVMARTVPHHGLPIAAALAVGLAPSLLDGVPVPSRGALAKLAQPVLYASTAPAPAGGLPVPQRLRPSPLHFICRVLPESEQGPVLDFVRRRRFEFLDFDVV